MKTLLKSLVIAATFAFATTSATFADDVARPSNTASTPSFKVGIYTATDGKLVVMVDKQPGRHVDVQLKNNKGQSVLLQHLSKKDLKTRMKLNLSQLEDGKYTVLITSGKETTEHNLTLSTHQPAAPARLVAVN